MNAKDEQRRDSLEPPQTATSPPESHVQESGSTGVQERTAPPRLDRLPQYRVLLHNDNVSDAMYVVETLCDLTPLMPQRAAAVMLEAHRTGIALVLVTHQERAELYVDQFRSKQLKVTIEPAA
jgi:ATP-dependent Clp protease adaptor protein ClpS